MYYNQGMILRHGNNKNALVILILVSISFHMLLLIFPLNIESALRDTQPKVLHARLLYEPVAELRPNTEIVPQKTSQQMPKQISNETPKQALAPPIKPNTTKKKSPSPVVIQTHPIPAKPKPSSSTARITNHARIQAFVEQFTQNEKWTPPKDTIQPKGAGAIEFFAPKHYGIKTQPTLKKFELAHETAYEYTHNGKRKCFVVQKNPFPSSDFVPQNSPPMPIPCVK